MMNNLNYLRPGIRLTVAALNAAGFETCDSGDGEAYEFENDREESFVMVVTSAETMVSDSRALLRFLELNQIHVAPFGSEGVLVRVMYDPLDDTAMIDVSGIHDDMLPDVVTFPGDTIVAGHSA